MTYVDFLIVFGFNFVCLFVVFFLRNDVPHGVDEAFHTILTNHRDPNSKDTNYFYGQEWLNASSNTRWVLEAKSVTEDGLSAHWRDVTQHLFKVTRSGTGSTNIAQAVCGGGSAIASVSSRPKVPFTPYPPTTSKKSKKMGEK